MSSKFDYPHSDEIRALLKELCEVVRVWAEKHPEVLEDSQTDLCIRQNRDIYFGGENPVIRGEFFGIAVGSLASSGNEPEVTKDPYH